MSQLGLGAVRGDISINQADDQTKKDYATARRATEYRA